MDFNELLEKYENDMVHVARMTKADSLSFFKKSKEYWDGYKKACFSWFQHMKNEIGFIPKIKQLTEEEIRVHKYIDESKQEYFPYKALVYRGEIIPIYMDENGQQDFIVYHDKIYCGGAYNLAAENDFCFFVDKIKDEID